MELFEADGHHYEIGHHLVGADESAKGFDHLRYIIACKLELAISFLGGSVPVPGVFESRYLRLGFNARFVFEKYVVIAV